MSLGQPSAGSLVRWAFRRHANHPCFVWESGEASYREVGGRVAALADWLRREVPQGGRVGILLGTRREYVESILGCALAARVRVPLNAREPVEVQVRKLAHSGAAVLITDESWSAKLIEEGLPPQMMLIVGGGQRPDYESVVGANMSFMETSVIPQAPLRLSYTGGTTGEPKAVTLTHRNELAMVRNLLLEAYRPRPGTVFVAGASFSHATGSFVLPTIVGGGAIACIDSFDPERLLNTRWGSGDRLGVQTFAVPTMLQDLAGAVVPNAWIDAVVYGGAPCPRSVLEQAHVRFGSALVQIYGQAEAPMTITLIDGRMHAKLEEVAGSAGRPFAFNDVRVVDAEHEPVGPGEVGEVLVRAEHVMAGYWGDETETARKLLPDGALRTEDIGYVDEQGLLWLVDRSREIIISGGYNVYPSEVERRLANVEGLQAAVVFGVPHPRWGEAVVAAVVAEEGIDSHTLEARVLATARTALADFQRPKGVVIVDEFPTTLIGKVSRRALSDRYRALFDEASSR